MEKKLEDNIGFDNKVYFLEEDYEWILIKHCQ